MVNDETYDVVIAGCGAGGLYTALNLPSDLSILMIAKTEVDECDSMLAQGGICVLHDEDDYQAFFDDTLRAGHGENRHESVDIMIRSSRAVINDLIDYGVDFARTETGELAYTREAAHSASAHLLPRRHHGKRDHHPATGGSAPKEQRRDPRVHDHGRHH